MPLRFETLSAYEKSVDTIAWVLALGDGRELGSAVLIWDSLARASVETAAAIARAGGRARKGAKRDALDEARDEVLRSLPLLRVLQARGLLDDSDYENGRSRLEDLARELKALREGLGTGARARPAEKVIPLAAAAH